MSDDAPSDADLFSTSDGAVLRATKRARADWFALLDEWGAAGKDHTTIAAWLVDAHSVDHWWAQTITVDYERARGLREKGGRRDGTFDANASKTIGVPVRELFRAVADPARRAGWLPDADLRERTTRTDRSARFDWGDGPTRVEFHFAAKGDGRSQVSVQHRRLPDRETAEERKAFWRARLGELKARLEGVLR